jgi:hypothetical protein
MTNNTPDYKDNLYFDSQNKKNEQQKNLCITSEQLTKQLATESLPEYTEFYVRKKDGSTDTQTWLNRIHSSAVEWWNTFNITEVLAPVPSYEEWKVSYNCMLENEVLRLKNAQLKELLKECFEYIDWTDGTGSPISQQKLLDKINEVLK